MRAKSLPACAVLGLLTLLIGACAPLPAARMQGGDISPLSTVPLVLPQPALVSDRGSGLVGQVLAPATLVANHSGSLVSDRGGGLVSDRGGGFTNVQSLPGEIPLASATVRLEQADGTPVRDASGKPLEAITDASGRYRFEARLPVANLVLDVQVPQASGSLRGLALRDDLREGVRQGSVDLSSTLLTTYVQDRYLIGEAEAQQRLDRLNPTVVEDTRTAVRQGIAGISEAFPDVSIPRLLDAVDRLRSQDTRVASRFEDLHRLLVDAGQSDRGNGRLADSVALEYTLGMAVDARGSIHYWSGEQRLWKITSDGYLVARLDAIASLPDTPSGWPGGQVRTIPRREYACLDAEGRLVFLYNRWLMRQEFDGSLTQLAEDGEHFGRRPIASTPDGHLWIIDATTAGIRVHAWRADQGLVEHPSVPGNPSVSLFGVAGTVGGHLLLYVSREGQSDGALLEYAPATGRWSERSLEGNGVRPIPGAHMDPRGNLFFRRNRQLWCLREGTDKPEYLVHWDPVLNWTTAEMTPDGRKVFVCGYRQVYRVAQERLIRVAGVDSTVSTGNQSSQDLALSDPRALGIHTDGTRYVWDEDLARLIRIAPDGRVDTVDMGDLTALVTSERIRTIRAGSDGKPLLCRARRILAPGQPGSAFLMYEARADIADFDHDAAGNLIVSERLEPQSPRFRVVRIGKEGQREDLFTTEVNLEFTSLASGPDGSITLCGDARLRRWTPGTGLVTLGTDQAFASGDPDQFLRNLVVRSDGMVFGTQGDLGEDNLWGYGLPSIEVDGEPSSVWRFDPATGQLRVLAGKKGLLFNGTGVDDSLLDPCSPAFSPEGDLLFIDRKHRQIKRIPRDRLD